MSKVYKYLMTHVMSGTKTQVVQAIPTISPLTTQGQVRKISNFYVIWHVKIGMFHLKSDLDNRQLSYHILLE